MLADLLKVFFNFPCIFFPKRKSNLSKSHDFTRSEAAISQVVQKSILSQTLKDHYYVDIIIKLPDLVYLLLDQGRQFSQCCQRDRLLGNDISVLQQVLCQGPYRQHLKTSLSSLCTRLAAPSVKKKEGMGMGESSNF